MPTKTILKRLQKTCACCACPSVACKRRRGKAIHVIVYSKKDYRGGHFFGKLPLYTKKEEARAHSFGFTKEFFGKTEIRVMNKDPKPYGYVEYCLPAIRLPAKAGECPKCYWQG